MVLLDIFQLRRHILFLQIGLFRQIDDASRFRHKAIHLEQLHRHRPERPPVRLERGLVRLPANAKRRDDPRSGDGNALKVGGGHGKEKTRMEATQVEVRAAGFTLAAWDCKLCLPVSHPRCPICRDAHVHVDRRCRSTWCPALACIDCSCPGQRQCMV